VEIVVKAVDRPEIVHEQLVLLHPLVLHKLREIVWGDAETMVVSRQDAMHFAKTSQVTEAHEALRVIHFVQDWSHQ